MIKDLLSHKLHSSKGNWPDKLTELAAIFGEFDGEIYDRAKVEERLKRISPRTSTYSDTTGRADVSKFRDEISAYPAYLGLYFLERSPAGWVLRVSTTTRRFLLREEPDVASFLRLQLPLFQYPNGMGGVHRKHTNNLHIQANTRDRTLKFIGQSIHLSPLRLIAVALKADAELRGLDIHEASITFDEVYALANTSRVNRQALPRLDCMVSALDAVRKGKLPVPERYERRLHTLNHTEIFLAEHKKISLRKRVNEPDGDQLVRQLNAICKIDCQFNGFDGCTTGADLAEVVGSGDWGRYFDGSRTLPSDIVQALTSDDALEKPLPSGHTIEDDTPTIFTPTDNLYSVYPFRDRGSTPRV